MRDKAERLRDVLKRIARDAERPAKDGRAGCHTGSPEGAPHPTLSPNRRAVGGEGFATYKLKR